MAELAYLDFIAVFPVSSPGRWKQGHHRTSVSQAACAWRPHRSAGTGVTVMSLQRQDEGRGCCRDGLG